MTNWVIVPFLLSIISALLVAVFWFMSFAKYPVQNTLRAAVGILAILAGNLAAPALDGFATLSIDLSPVVSVQSASIQISSGSTGTDWIVAFLSLSLLAAVCVFKSPPGP